MRLGVARKYFGFNDQVDKLMSERLEDLQETWRDPTLIQLIFQPTESLTPQNSKFCL